MADFCSNLKGFSCLNLYSWLMKPAGIVVRSGHEIELTVGLVIAELHPAGVITLRLTGPPCSIAASPHSTDPPRSLSRTAADPHVTTDGRPSDVAPLVPPNPSAVSAFPSPPASPRCWDNHWNSPRIQRLKSFRERHKHPRTRIRASDLSLHWPGSFGISHVKVVFEFDPKMEATMPSQTTRRSASAPDGSSLPGILACLGALVSEAQSLGETKVAAVLLEAAEKLRRGSLKMH
jgi:hypothetical protein